MSKQETTIKSKSEKAVKSAKPVAKPTKVKSTTNPMRNIKIEKLILSAGGVDDNLKKAKKLLEIISAKKVKVVASTKRIPTFKVNPGLEVGVCVTLRGKEAVDMLRRLLGATDNKISKKSIAQNHFSFGIKEYIEIPGMEYHREIGVRGLNVTISFIRAGVRVTRKKIKRGSLPKKQYVTQAEIIKYLEEQFKTVIA